MGTIKFFHSLAFGVLTSYEILAIRAAQSDARFLWLFWLGYAVLLCGLLLNNIWCARLLALPPLLVVFFTAPQVVYNVYAFASGNPMYLDSPATIFVIILFASIVIIPCTFVLGAYWHHRTQIFGVGKRGPNRNRE